MIELPQKFTDALANVLDPVAGEPIQAYSYMLTETAEEILEYVPDMDIDNKLDDDESYKTIPVKDIIKAHNAGWINNDIVQQSPLMSKDAVAKMINHESFFYSPAPFNEGYVRKLSLLNWNYLNEELPDEKYVGHYINMDSEWNWRVCVYQSISSNTAIWVYQYTDPMNDVKNIPEILTLIDGKIHSFPTEAIDLEYDFLKGTDGDKINDQKEEEYARQTYKNLLTKYPEFQNEKYKKDIYTDR